MVNFVDDGTNFVADEDPEVVTKAINQNYRRIEDWMNCNKLVINADKTHYIVAAGWRAAQLRTEVKLTAGDFQIEQSETQKLLGGTVPNDGKWNLLIRDHKNSIVKQINSRLNDMKMLVNGESNTRLMVVSAVIQSKLQYLMPLWGGPLDYLLHALQV